MIDTMNQEIALSLAMTARQERIFFQESLRE